jgi:hypothetical protein
MEEIRMSKLDDTFYIPRFSFEISEELKARTNKLLSTHGIRKAIMTPILEDLLDMIEEHGQIVVGVILDASVKPREVIKSMAKAEKRSSNG